jgi:hypothetical protein
MVKWDGIQGLELRCEVWILNPFGLVINFLVIKHQASCCNEYDVLLPRDTGTLTLPWV